MSAPNSDISARTLATLTNLSYRSGELKPYLDSLCEGLINVLGEGIAAVTLYKDNKKHVLAVVPKERQPEGAVEVHGYLSTYVVNHKQSLNIEDANLTPQYGKPPQGYCSYLGMPLILPNGKVVGTLCYFDKNKRQYSDQEQQSSELFAEKAAIALDNFELYQQLHEYSENLEDQVEQRTRELLKTREQLMHKEKLAEIGVFASRITHEIRNPLATIRLVLEFLQKTEDKKSSKRATLAVNEVQRLEQLLNGVLAYAKPVQINTEPVHLTQWLKDFLITHDSMLDKAELTEDLNYQDQPIVLADTNSLTQICLNLLKNACDASLAGGSISWTIGVSDEGGFISVHNQGTSIPANKLPHITEAFITAKAGGSGLGLAIVKSLVDAQKGLLDIKSDEAEGTTIIVTLPLFAR